MQSSRRTLRGFLLAGLLLTLLSLAGRALALGTGGEVGVAPPQKERVSLQFP